MKKSKWTIIDTVIIIAVAAAAAVAWVMFGPSMRSTSDQKVTFTVMIQDREKGLAAAMAAGDNVTLSLTEKDGGVIKDVRTEPTVVMVYDSINGVYRNEVNEEREDIYIDIEADCAVSDIAITTGDTEIKVGQDIPVRGKGYATNGYIIGINDEGGAQ
ncbi:MAG TPA: DUF4330 family protein [Candidatus Ornithomonoglobus intestinigallinarum]|jgi:hypothetical protein|uniref:DUF4330 family protein n=1 Tax=Candidatus Ornithomonoglobus intestinigallinarum TaxID=2840894 RepID=A0A9D1KQ04_9FIRM|nr:DUF4330 family protein [Candidatus Ornithomonoglobus intestinigallinarum]